MIFVKYLYPVICLIALSTSAFADCALVLTSPADGAVITSQSNQVTVKGYVKASVQTGYGYIELSNNSAQIQRWEGTFTSAQYVLQNGVVSLGLSEQGGIELYSAFNRTKVQS